MKHLSFKDVLTLIGNVETLESTEIKKAIKPEIDTTITIIQDSSLPAIGKHFI